MRNNYRIFIGLGFFLSVSTFCLFAQVGINANSSAPDASAGLDVDFSNKGFLPPRMTTVQRNGIASPAEGLVVYNLDEKALNMYNGVAWKSLTPVDPFVCGLTITANHVVSRGVAPVNKTVAYGTVSGIPGELTKCWLSRNLGASQQATVVSDATEASSGWYFQFNHKQGFQYNGSRIPTSVWINNISESSNWVTANDPCSIELGAGWRLPTSTEWTNVDASGVWTDWNQPFGSALKLHAAGYLGPSDGALNDRGAGGYYWSSTHYAATYGWYLYFISSYSTVFYNTKSNGFPVRCLTDL